jgi:exonuclease SbcD
LLVERERIGEQAVFLDWLIEVLRREKVEALLVSGDVFDAANPPQEAVALYFDFLKVEEILRRSNKKIHKIKVCHPGS